MNSDIVANLAKIETSLVATNEELKTLLNEKYNDLKNELEKSKTREFAIIAIVAVVVILQIVQIFVGV